MPAARTQSIEYDDYARIRGAVSSSLDTDREFKRQELKKKSLVRYTKWPNTLDAMHNKKDRWKKDKEDREELARIKIDEEEARLQDKLKKQQIERANYLLYEQTDRMKTLRSKQLLADVVHHRKTQIEEKQSLKQQDQDIDREYDCLVLKNVLDKEEEEQEERRRVQKERLALATLQKEQLEEYKQRYINELRREKREGDEMIAKAQADLLQDREREEARRIRMKKGADETMQANAQLKRLREKEKEQQRAADLMREEDAIKKEQQIARRLELQNQKREHAFARKQRLIDLATQNLVRLEQKTEERVFNQSEELRKKEDERIRERNMRRAAEKEEIDRSRKGQLDRKAQQKLRDQEEAMQMKLEWEQYGKLVQVRAQQEKENQWENDTSVAIDQKKQADARRQLESFNKMTSLLEEENSLHQVALEDARFRQVASDAIKEARDFGITNVVPLEKAMAENRIDLLAASGFRI